MKILSKKQSTIYVGLRRLGVGKIRATNWVKKRITPKGNVRRK